MLGSNKARIVKLEQARGVRARRYYFCFDEEAEARAQGLPCVLGPRELSREEWIKKYSPKCAASEPGQSENGNQAVRREAARREGQ